MALKITSTCQNHKKEFVYIFGIINDYLEINKYFFSLKENLKNDVFLDEEIEEMIKKIEKGISNKEKNIFLNKQQLQKLEIYKNITSLLTDEEIKILNDIVNKNEKIIFINYFINPFLIEEKIKNWPVFQVETNQRTFERKYDDGQKIIFEEQNLFCPIDKKEKLKIIKIEEVI